MHRSGHLNVVGAQLSTEREPILDGRIRIAVALFSRRQLLECRREHAHLHHFRFESFDRHQYQYATVVHAPPRRALSRIESTMQFARYEEVPPSIAEEIMAKVAGKPPARTGSR